MTFLIAFLGIGKRIAAWFMADPLRILFAALVIFAAWQYMGKQNALGKLADEQGAHIATKAGYVNAQKVAADMNAKQVERIESERKEIASAKDAEIRSGIDRAIADARRVWAARAAKGVASSASASEIATGPVDTNGAGGMPVMDESDVRICTVNTMLAKGWQDFYEGLRAADSPQ
jgi:hypothetical protein